MKDHEQERESPIPSHLIAHVRKGTEGPVFEPLLEHLLATANTAQMHASAFGAGTSAFISGLLHDLGKADPRFQAYLLGQGPQHPHSSTGARAAIDHVRAPIGKLLSYCIAGHHAGLPNAHAGSYGGAPLLARMQAEPPGDLPTWLQVPKMQPSDLPDAFRNRAHRESAFAAQFMTRMIFSSLIDADRTETARFMGSLPGEALSGEGRPTLPELSQRLAVHLEGLAQPSPSMVNDARARVLSSALEAGLLAPGLFSLSVPTGGGKTLSSLAFALRHAIVHGLRRVIYVVPYTSIIEQTADVFRDALGPGAVLEHHTSFDRGSGSSVAAYREATQTWEAPIIVTTAVQFFESLYSNRPARCRKLHRIARSVVILDEAQTMPLDLLRPCLAAIRELGIGYGSSLVLCTATQPAILKEDGFRPPEALSRSPGDALPLREIAPDPDRLHRELKRVSISDAGTVPDANLAQHIAGAQRCLTIVNSRAHARALASACRALEGALHLTTTMTPRHRRQVLNDVRRRLQSGAPVRLVATSLVEAGVDLDFPVVWRAIAGLDAIAQAAGRCNREGLMHEPGEVHIFRPDPAYPAPQALHPHIAATEAVLKSHDDLLSPAAIKDWCARVYWARDNDFDRARIGGGRGILSAIEAGGINLDFPFADISRSFRMIEEGGTPVIIPGEFGLTDEELSELAGEESGKALAEAFQSVQVQVPEFALEQLRAQRHVAPWRRDSFGDQFLLLQGRGLYDPYLGLMW